MRKVIHDEYRVSDRVVIRIGDKFRAKGGPYWKGPSGEKVSMTPKGPYKFHRHVVYGKKEWIECLDRDGQFAVLHVAGRRRSPAGLVTRPFTIVGKTRVDRKKTRR